MGNANSGRKKQSKSRADASRSLALLDPIAVRTIEDTMSGVNTDRLKYEAAVMVYIQNHGKPSQRVEHAGDKEAPVSIVVRYEGENRATTDEGDLTISASEDPDSSHAPGEEGSGASE